MALSGSGSQEFWTAVRDLDNARADVNMEVEASASNVPPLAIPPPDDEDRAPLPPAEDAEELPPAVDAQAHLPPPRPALFNPQEMHSSTPICSLKSPNGAIFAHAVPIVSTENTPVVADFQKLVSNLERLSSPEDIKYQSFIILGFTNGDGQGERIYDHIAKNKCDIFGVNCVEPNVCTAVLRRTSPRMRFNLDTFTIDHIFVVKNHAGFRKSAHNDMILTILKAWLRTSLNYKVNFSIENAQDLTSNDLLDDWQDLNDKEVEKIILECEEKVACERPYDTRESFIAKMGRKVLAFRRSSCSTPSCVIFTTHSDILDLDSFINLANVKCKTFNPIDGTLIEFGLPEFITKQCSCEKLWHSPLQFLPPLNRSWLKTQVFWGE